MISPESKDACATLYQENKDLIEHDVQFGSEWNRRVALTIKKVAGVE